MTNRKKLFLILDIMLLSGLFLISSTDYIWKEKKIEVSNISVIVDLPQDSTNANLRAGLKKAAQAYHADVHFLNQREYQAQQVDMQTLVQREIESGCEGIFLQCSRMSTTEEILSNIPNHIPVVLFDTMLEEPDVKAEVGFDVEAAAQLLVQQVAAARDKGQSVTLVSRKGCSDMVTMMHDRLEQLFPTAGIMVRRVELSDYTESWALVSGLAAQGGNMVVSCEAPALEAMAQVCEDGNYTLPLYGMGWSGVIREQLEKGNIAGCMVEDSYAAGYFGIETLTKLLHEKIPFTQEMVSKVVWVTGRNLYNRDQEAILFPFV